MHSRDLWQRYQDWLYFHEPLGIFLDVSRMGLDDVFVAQLEPKFAQAFEAMHALENGALANPDEKRMVGHYWLRNSDLAPVEFKAEIESAVDQVEAFAKKILQGDIKPLNAPRFTDVISIGIGGSALGPQFVTDALSPDLPPISLHFIDNTDPAGIDRILSRLQERLHTTLVIVVSKSGGTFETRNGMAEVKHAYARNGLNFSNYAVAITMSGSQLDVQEQCDNWLAKFVMFDWMGGRFSILSSVGLLPSALLGIDIRALLAGARLMDQATRVQTVKQNPAALLALTWFYASQGHAEKDMVVLAYKDSLVLFGRYLQQLVMESLGKAFDLDGKEVHQGLTVYGNKGSTDQHAFVQQLREGPNDFFVTFVEVLKDREAASIDVEPGVTSGDFLFSFMQGTRHALYEKQRESVTLTLSTVDAKSIGALIALYERAVGLYATLVNLNAYDQPGVEAGKKVAGGLLVLQRKIMTALQGVAEPISLPELAELIGETDRIETIYSIIRHLAANPRGLRVEGNQAKPGELKISLS